jgi:DNA-binding NarL/FixJ family response regulator
MGLDLRACKVLLGGLSRARAVRKLIARGQSNDEIALELFVTRATVRRT